MGWSFVLEPEMVEQVFIREEAMVRGWSEADLWGWAAVSSRLESILLYPLEGNFHSKLASIKKIFSFDFIIFFHKCQY